jgi:adenosylhomocysteine nucleosidase
VKILVTFAVDAEFAPWRKRNDFKIVTRTYSGQDSSLKLYRAEGDGVEVDVLLTGIGWSPAAAASMVEELETRKPDVCISSGLAGALRSDFHLGEVLVAARVVRSDTAQSLATSIALMTAAVKSGATSVKTFVTNGGIVGDARSKQELSSFGDAVEMESFHVLSSVSARRIPIVAIRAVSDTVEQDLPLDFSKVVDRAGHVRWTRMARELGRHPGKISPLIQFGRESRRAAHKLAEFLDDYVDDISETSLPPAMEAAALA